MHPFPLRRLLLLLLLLLRLLHHLQPPLIPFLIFPLPPSRPPPHPPHHSLDWLCNTLPDGRESFRSHPHLDPIAHVSQHNSGGSRASSLPPSHRFGKGRKVPVDIKGGREGGREGKRIWDLIVAGGADARRKGGLQGGREGGREGKVSLCIESYKGLRQRRSSTPPCHKKIHEKVRARLHAACLI